MARQKKMFDQGSLANELQGFDEDFEQQVKGDWQEEFERDD